MENKNKNEQRRFLEIYSETLDMKKAAYGAGYSKNTAIAIATNMVRQKKFQKQLQALCENKAERLEICLGYIIEKYVKILKWATETDEKGKPNDPALALRALEGLTKQLSILKGDDFEETDSIPIIRSILNLDTNKI